MIKVNNENRALVLAALYNVAKPQGMGFLHYNPRDMTKQEAQEILDFNKGKSLYFDYFRGRVMKIDLGQEHLDFYLYDRDNGPGAGEQACKGLGV